MVVKGYDESIIKVVLSGILFGINLANEFPNIKDLLKSSERDTANFLKSFAIKILSETV